MLAVVVVLGGLAVAGWWFFLRDDAPPEAALPVRTTPSTASGAAPAAADGTWTVQQGADVFAGYRIKEQFAGDTIEKTAVGRSPAVTGTMTVQGAQIPAATFEVDLTELTSDSGRRDSSQQGGGLQIGQFPTARFALTAPITLPGPPSLNTPVEVQATGDLTLHGVTKPVTVRAEGQLDRRPDRRRRHRPHRAERLRHRAAIGRRLRRRGRRRLVRGAAHVGPDLTDRSATPVLSTAALPSVGMARRHRVVIVGAGFGGLSATKALAKAPVDVVLVDANNYHLFQPLLYQVATAGLDADDVAYPVRGIFHRQRNVDVVLGRVSGADLEAHELHVAGVGTIGFDSLVLSAGAVTATYGIPGVDEHAYSLKSLQDAVALRHHVLRKFEEAARRPELIDEGALTVVVVGGGPTGVELSGGMVELFTKVLAKDFKDLDVRRARVVLVEMTDRVLGTFTPRLSGRALATLREHGRRGGARRRRREGRARGRPPRRRPTHPGPHVGLGGGGAGRGSGCAARAGGRARRAGGRRPGSGRARPSRRATPSATSPLRSTGRARCCPSWHRWRSRPATMWPVRSSPGWRAAPRKPFHYRDKGTMATIGRNHGIAQLPGHIRLSGFPGWLAWLGLHLVLLIGFRNRANVLVNWAWNYLTYDRGARLILD